jgi:AraC-like DNA-binding protein
LNLNERDIDLLATSASSPVCNVRKSTRGGGPAVGNITICRPAALSGVVLVRGTTARYVAEPKIGEYVIGRIDRGTVAVRRDRRRHDLSKGDIVVWNADHRHSWESVDGRPWSARWIVFEPPRFELVLGETVTPASDLALRSGVLRDPTISAAFATLHRRLWRSAAMLERETAFVELIELLGARRRDADVRRTPRSAARLEPALRKACEYMRARLSSNIALAELAAASGVDRFRLIRLFREATGMPPHRFQIVQRIIAARKMLENGAVEMADIAETLGFADQSHFYRHFHSALGITPLEYGRRFVRFGANPYAQSELQRLHAPAFSFYEAARSDA